MPASLQTEVTCPFCGLLCDDLTVELDDAAIRVTANGCPLARAGFELAGGRDSMPRVSGQPVTLAAATAEAARLLAASRRPLVGGLATDVAGVRAATRLASRCGGVLDHMNSAAGIRNTLVLQDGGWITTTLSEVRNRADLLIVAGGDVESRFPRLFERTIATADTLFGEGRRCEVVFVGKGPAAAGSGPRPEVIAADVARLAEGFGLLRMLLAGRPVRSDAAAGVALPVWRKLADRMKAASYGVIVWAAVDFDFPHAELTVQALAELLKDLNQHTRFAGLPLGGSDGDLTADAVSLWQTGYGMRTGFGRGIPEHDPYHLSTTRLLETGEADALVWVSSFQVGRTPPATSIPTIVLGRGGMRFEREPAVFIPVGTPGVDHSGHLFRADRVVALPLKAVRPASLPSVAEALEAIEAALPAPA
jgi:formylmethanofuran dehydrogenase subunit B